MTTKYTDTEDCDDDVMEMEPQNKRLRPRVQRTWSTEHIYKLICSVKLENCIWNAASDNYSNKVARKDAWSRVCAAFDGLYDVSELHAKWTNLRIQYRNTTARSHKSRCVWKFSNALSFLRQGFLEAEAGEPANKVTYNITHPCNSSIEDSNDSMLNVSSASVKETSVPTASAQTVISIAAAQRYRRSRATLSSPASISAAAIRDRDGQTMYDRDAALVQYLLTELRSLSEHEASVLRCRLQRTLLEFNEERQNSPPTVNEVEHGMIDIKYGRVDN